MWGACGRQQLFSKKLAIQRPVRTPAIRVTRADRTDSLYESYQSTPSPVDSPYGFGRGRTGNPTVFRRAGEETHVNEAVKPCSARFRGPCAVYGLRGECCRCVPCRVERRKAKRLIGACPGREPWGTTEQRRLVGPTPWPRRAWQSEHKASIHIDHSAPLASMPGDARQRLETRLAKARIKCEGLAASDSQHDGKAQAVDEAEVFVIALLRELPGREGLDP